MDWTVWTLGTLGNDSRRRGLIEDQGDFWD